MPNSFIEHFDANNPIAILSGDVYTLIMVAAKKQNVTTRTKAQDYGLDIAAIKANLKRSYAQRIRRHDIALETMKKLQKAKFL